MNSEQTWATSFQPWSMVRESPPGRRIARMGIDSLVAPVLYALGVVGLVAIARSG